MRNYPNQRGKEGQESCYYKRYNPYAGEKMKRKFRGLWRLRVGDYRIIYEIYNEIILVMILRIADRKNS